MAGGSAEGWALARPVLDKMAAAVGEGRKREPCLALFGPGGAGHYVKMAHNGIEYAVMQLIAEGYHLLKVGRAAVWGRGAVLLKRGSLISLTSSRGGQHWHGIP